MSSHVVTSNDKKIEWIGIAWDFPVKIETNTCESCGRQLTRFYCDKTGITLKKQQIPKLLTIEKLCDKYRFFSTSDIRGFICDEYNNGLAKSGALHKGRKIRIYESKFIAWFESYTKTIYQVKI